jgi:glutamyl-tRNA(Gln) amidotransferase subunit D
MEFSKNFGNKVEIEKGKEVFEGILLPSSEGGSVLLKLENGYNIGFNKKEIVKLRVLEKIEKKENSVEIKKDSKKPNVALVITGGTIASRYDSDTGGVKPLDTPESLFKFYPEIFEKVNVLKIETPFMKFSEDMDYKDWQSLARTVEKLLNDSNIQGVIITHGTDFLHYTSAALSFMLRDLTKPVVLTYSQRSIDRASSDANLNLICSAEVTGLSDMAGVFLVGHANSEDDFCHVMSGVKVRKLHTSRRDAFKCVNDKPIAKVYKNKIHFLTDYKKKKKGKISLDTNFEEKVALVKFYPGQNPDILDYYSEKGYKGIVIELAGIGQLATSGSRNSWVKKIKELVKKGVVVCGTSQCINGRVDPYVYSSGRELEEAGLIYLEDMHSETAFVKLGWVLGHKDWNPKEKILENICGEFNSRLEY